jgi:hypothetical protein
MTRNSTAWQIAREELRPKFAVAGIDRCEYQGYNCEDWRNLTFAHSLRRNDINKYKKYDPDMYNKKMREVARLCTTCHAEVDANKRHVTYAIINWIIDHKRKVKI